MDLLRVYRNLALYEVSKSTQRVLIISAGAYSANTEYIFSIFLFYFDFFSKSN